MKKFSVHQRIWFLVLAVFLAALALYIPTLAPGLLWGGGDFATFQTRVPLLMIDPEIHGHPLYVLLARPFTWLPVRDMAYRTNLASAVFSASALALLFYLTCNTTGALLPSLLATLALLVSHTFWTYAVLPKPYALNSLILVTTLYLLFQWGKTRGKGFLRLAGVLLGLATMNHALFVLILPAALLYICLRIPSRRLIACTEFTALFGIGLLPFVALNILGGETARTGGYALGFIRNLFAVLTTPSYWPTGALVFVAALLYQFFLITPAGLIGCWVALRRDRAFASLLLAIYLIDVAFTWSWLPSTPQLSSYMQNFHFYLPSYVIFAIWIGYGLDWLYQRHRWNRVACIMLVDLIIGLPILAYVITPHIAQPVMTALNPRPLPGRDAATYLFSPWKHTERGARILGEQILQALPPDSVLFADYSIWSVIRYLQMVEQARPDVELVQLPPPPEQVPLILSYSGRLLFLADVYPRYYDLEGISQYFDIAPLEPVYQLVPKPRADSTGG